MIQGNLPRLIEGVATGYLFNFLSERLACKPALYYWNPSEWILTKVWRKKA